jgi:hypothetical protein
MAFDFSRRTTKPSDAIVERFNRTLKTKMWKYFTANNMLKYVDILQKLVKSYNHSRHRSIGMRPIDVNKSNENIVWQTLYGKESKKSIQFKVARYSYHKNPAQESRTQNRVTIFTRRSRVMINKMKEIL